MKKLTLLFTAILTVFLFALPAYAADITLSSRCALADAIIAANHDRAEGGCQAGRGADTITFTRDITLDGGLPKITSAITIEGNGYTISGDQRYPIFDNAGGALTIKDLTMTKGRVEGDGTVGGAIINREEGELSISGSSFSHNSAGYQGGAIFNLEGALSISDSSFSHNSADWGGAIVNRREGELSISDSNFSHNSADIGGGAIVNQEEGELSISGSSFSHNSADWGGAIVNLSAGALSISDSSFSDNSVEDQGGAIRNWGELSISDSSFSHNSADTGGAIFNAEAGELSIGSSAFNNNSANWGGAINNWDGTVSITDSAFSDNSAADSGGAIVIGNAGELSISDSVFSHSSAEEGGAIDNEGKLGITDSTFSGNSAIGDEDDPDSIGLGGAVSNRGELSISESSFSSNSSADWGGAIYNGGEGTLTIGNSNFSNNSAIEDDPESIGSGGAISNWGELSISDSVFSGNSADWGGTIINWGGGELNISGSTFNDNSADGGGAIDNGGVLNITNSTFSGNSADGGGAIDNGGVLNITNSTFSGNSADWGDAIINWDGELSITNSIIAGRGRGACYASGGLKQNKRNFVQDGSCNPWFAGDPKLGALVVPEDGSPAYFPLLAGSRAIDAAHDDYCPETDQIGTVRPQGVGCDLGAFEYVAES